jgi:hypothetical protein
VPHIIVTADSETDRSGGTIMLRERISSSDLQSQHFSQHLLERVEWAVGDAQEAEAIHQPGPGPETDPSPDTDPDGYQPERSAKVLTTAS